MGNVICSFMDSSGEASGPIKRCLFIGYIIIVILTLIYAFKVKYMMTRLKYPPGQM